MTTKTTPETPAAAGYAMPAEWAPHAATWIAWPHNREDWPGRFTPIPWIYADIVRLLARAERVRIIVRDDADARRVRRMLARNDVRLDNVDLLPLPTDRVWTRDSGPSIVRRADGARAVVHWEFNAWAKYDNYALDAKVPELVARTLGVETFRPVALDAKGRRHRIVLEGGSIEVDGAGTVMTTEECLLSDVQARNPGLSRAAIEDALCAYLGARQVLWLDRGIAGDDTHGHIDDTARFAGPGRVVTCVEPNRDDANHEPLAENLRRLRAARDAEGRPFEIVELPMPAPVIFDGQRLPASYANFYVANAGVLVPVFNDPNDRLALDVLAACFADRPVIPVYCRDLVWGLGTLHCMTQQEPE